MIDLIFVQMFYEDYIITFGFGELTSTIQTIIETIQFQNESK